VYLLFYMGVNLGVNLRGDHRLKALRTHVKVMFGPERGAVTGV
jgi:hypothetical protein